MASRFGGVATGLGALLAIGLAVALAVQIPGGWVLSLVVVLAAASMATAARVVVVLSGRSEADEARGPDEEEREEGSQTDQALAR